MQEITRFMLLRPPVPAGTAAQSIPLSVTAEFLTPFKAAAARSNPGGRLAAASTQQRLAFAVPPFDAAGLAGRLEKWGAAILASPEDNRDVAFALASSLLSVEPKKIVRSADFERTKSRLAQLLVCDKYRGFADAGTELAGRAYRAAILLQDLASDADAVSSPQARMRRSLLIDVVRLPPPTKPAHLDAQPDVKTLDRVNKSIDGYQAAMREIDNAPTHLVIGSQGDTRQPVLSQDLVKSLSPAARRALTDSKVRIGQDAPGVAMDQLANGLRALYEKKDALEQPHVMQTHAVRLGSGVYEVSTTPAASAAGIAAHSLPTSHGAIKPVGIADLLVVRQHLLRYEAMDISFIENVLIGENRSREHRSSLATEDITTVASTTTREQERDLQSTDRSEMQRETSNALQEQLSMQLGTKLSGSYGPAVQFAVNTDLGSQHTTQEAEKFASTVAQEATQRAATKVTETFQQTHSLKVASSTEEINIHAIDNRQRDQHVVGMYQYLDKISQAQVFNYGNRLLFDVVVPEPAAILIALATQQAAMAASIPKPPPFDVQLNDIVESNLVRLANKFGATEIEPRPPTWRSVSKSLQTKGDPTLGEATASADLEVPDGYEAVKASIDVVINWFTSDDVKIPAVEVTCNGQNRGFTQTRSDSIDFAFPVPGAVTVGVSTYGANSCLCGVWVKCKLSAGGEAAWKLKVRSQLKQASDAQQKEYESKVARAKADAQDAAASDPVPARHTAQDVVNELKRSAISMFTRQAFDSFDATHVSGTSALPVLDYVQAEQQDPYIRFFEQAFEWQQMMYTFYPYFWGRKAFWGMRALMQEDDPDYAAFLKAGAARLVIPVRENFGPAVLHFMETGQVWSGGPVPDVSSPLYLSLVQELKEKTGAPGAEVAVGAPWEVRLPTALAKLRLENTLPTWSQQADGSFKPDA